jgi:hypothetical protein
VAGFCQHGNEPSGHIKKADYSLTSSASMDMDMDMVQDI